MIGAVLLALLVAVAALSYIASNRDAIDPAFVVGAVFAVSLAIALMRADAWGFTLHAAAAAAVVLGVLALAFGAIIGRAAAEARVALDRSPRAGHPANRPPERRSRAVRDVPGIVMMLLVLVFSLVVAFWSYRRMLSLAGSAGYAGDNVLHYVHRALDDGASWGFDLAVCQYLLFGVTYVLAALAIVQLVDPARRFKLRCLVPLPAFVAVQTMSAGRTGLVQFGVFCGVAVVIALRVYRSRTVRATPAVVVSALGLGAFALAFFAIGQFSGKSDLYEGPLDNLAVYFGTPIPALDAFFSQAQVPTADPPGFNTFAGLYNLLGRFGFPVPPVATHDASFVLFDGYGINTYTYLKALYRDYGYAGIGVLSFAIGAVYAYAGVRVRARRRFGLGAVLYAYFYYYLALLVVGAGMFNALLSVNQLLTLAGMGLAYALLWPRAAGAPLLRTRAGARPRLNGALS